MYFGADNDAFMLPIGTSSPGQDLRMLHVVELQVDSHSWSRRSGPQQTRPDVRLRWISGMRASARPASMKEKWKLLNKLLYASGFK